MLATLLFIVSCHLLSTITPVYTQYCGYQTCPKTKPDVINIHLVAHTHDDVGWLKTKDQYYYGQRLDIQEAGVEYILDSVVEALLENPDRRFIYVETAFFWQWWQEQTQAKKDSVRQLVDSGRLEIIGGAWSMNDEAAAHYQSIVDQFTWGFRRLNESLGACATPKIGWQIDPFGHSRENAAIMAKMGFDGLFLGRIDYQDKVSRHFDKAYEMIWHTSENDLSDDSKLFTCIMYNTYSPPPGFCFDVHCQDPAIVDNVKSPEYNVPERVGAFLSMMLEYSVPYRTKNIIVTMGNDFNYQYAGMNFKNMDKLIRYINEYESYGGKFHAFYSTPSCYLKAVHEANAELPSKSDDFFPYSSDPQSFWTGYFTSRPTQKRFERMGNNFLQVGKQILAMTNSPSSLDISEAKEAMGVMQHHDAITGTEKQHVASDYARILTKAMENVMDASSEALNTLVNKGGPYLPVSELEFHSCFLLNISTCHMTEDVQSFVVTVYNPLSRNVNKLVRLPISSTQLNWIVHGPEDETVPVQLVPLPHFVAIPGRESNVTVEIAFIAKDIPPLGFKSYYVESSKVSQKNFFTSEEVADFKDPVGYQNGIMITIDENGKIEAIKNKDSATDTPFHQDFLYYRGAVGDNFVDRGGERSSGAYIFRPNGTAIQVTDKPKTKIIKGPVVTEIQQQFSSWINQVIRVYDGADYIEFQWSVGPIPFQENDEIFGKEVITRYEVPTLKSEGIFYTDSNGREMLTRQRDYRPTWKVDLIEPISGNYYPVTTKINIKDAEDPTNTLTVVTDRSEGGTSLEDGVIELMLHRRLLHDDAFGVGEALNEMAFDQPLVAVGSHYVSLESCVKTTLLNQEKVLDAWIFISPTKGVSYEKWKSDYVMEFAGLQRALPDNVQILTLERWLDGEDEKKTFILRLENVMDKRLDPSEVEVNLKDLFATFSIINIKEMMLGANIPVEKSNKLKWHETQNSDADEDDSNRTVEQVSIESIKLKPMEIRTFLVEIEPHLISSGNKLYQAIVVH
ncbi:hypothetical protein O3M35_008077 [Rhynocoris fuscipes]|uniref:Alpha-mannosidase n=1 Tax=Rhynocoris fuscipes TaxID=488301 RepID=A0AAW1DC31_9HEMI